MRPPPEGRKHDITGQEGKSVEDGISVVGDDSELLRVADDFPLGLDGDCGLDVTTCSEHTVCPHMRVVGWSRISSQAGQRRRE